MPKYYYNLLKNAMSSSQVENLQRYNQETPSATSSTPNVTLDTSENNMTVDPTDPNKNSQKNDDNKQTDQKNNDTFTTPVKNNVLTDSIFSTPEAKTPKLKHKNGWYTCEICGKKEHGTEKIEAHMLTHKKTSTPISPIKKPAAYVKFQ